MKNRLFSIGKTAFLTAAMALFFGMTAMASASVEGDTELTAVDGEVVTAEFTITSDEEMESVTLTLSYDKDVLTYMSGSGGDNFAGSGGNGLVELSSKPNDTTATFAVKFRATADEDTTVEITGCTITLDGDEVYDVLNEESESDDEEELEDESDTRASWIIDERTFYLHNPGDMEGYEAVRMDIQGISSRVLKSDTLDLYLVYLHSDNGSYRDYFVYNPDTGNIVPYIEMESGTDTVIFIEPEEDGYVPTRYSYVDMPWGAKYSVPAYKHVIIDGVDEFFDDSNRYLVYGINQDGEKAWYSYDYDKNSLQLFDDVMYVNEQNYVTELETKVEGLNEELSYQNSRYNADMGSRLMIILVLVILVIVLLNAVVILGLRMRKMRVVEEEEDEEEPKAEKSREPGEVIVGNLEENETDFDEPFSDESGEDPELEIIDLDD